MLTLLPFFMFADDSFVPDAENIGVNGQRLKLKKLRPDAIPLLELGNDSTGTAEPSGISILDPVPGTSVPIVSDIADLNIGSQTEIGAQETVVDQQTLEPETPVVVVEPQISVGPLLKVVVEPVDPNIELIKQLRAEINIHRQLRVKDQQKIELLEKKNKDLELVIANLKDSFSKLDKVFCPEQIDMIVGKIKQPREWSDKAIHRATNIRYMCHESGYEFLRSVGFPLPSQSSLLVRLAYLQFSPGVLEDNIQLLKMYLDALPNGHNRHALVCYDEMSIKEGLEYNPTRQQITGFINIPRPPPKKTKIKIDLDLADIIEDDFDDNDDDDDDDKLLEEKFRLIANNVCVFMICGLDTRWKIPLAYFFTGHSFEARPMKEYIIKMIRAARGIAEINTKVLASDLGSCGLAVLKLFGISFKRNPKDPLKITNSFEIDGEIIRFCPDTEHLIKNMRCGFFNFWDKKKFAPSIGEAEFAKYKDLHDLVSRLVVWQHIVDLYEFDINKEFKLAPRLKSACFEFNSNFARMDVPTAIAVFSEDTAAALRMLVREHGFDKAYLTTAFFCDYFGKWVKIMTCRSSSYSLSYKNMEEYNDTMKFLTDFMLLIDSLEFPTKGRKPWQAGMICATTTIMELSKELLDSGTYEDVKPGRCSSAPCETFFSCIRSYNRSPSCLEVERILKVLSFIQMNKTTKNSVYLNDEDGPNWIATLKQLKAVVEKNAEKDENAIIFAEPCPNDFLTRDFSEEQVYVYVLGSVLKRTICTQSFCKVCKAFLVADEFGPEHKFIEMKQRKEGSLVPPSSDAINWFSQAEAYFQKNREVLLYEKPRTLDELAETVYNLLKENPLIPKCHLKLLVNRFYKFRMYFWTSYMHDQIVEKRKVKIKAQQQSSKSMSGWALK